MDRRRFVHVGGATLTGGLAGCTWWRDEEGEFPEPVDPSEIDEPAGESEVDESDLPPGVTPEGVVDALQLAETHKDRLLEASFIAETRLSLVVYGADDRILERGTILETVQVVDADTYYLDGLTAGGGIDVRDPVAPSLGRELEPRPREAYERWLDGEEAIVRLRNEDDEDAVLRADPADRYPTGRMYTFLIIIGGALNGADLIGVEERSNGSFAWLTRTTTLSPDMYGESNRLRAAGWFTPDGTGVEVLTRIEGTRFPAHEHPLADDPAVERYAEATSWTLRQLGTSVEQPDWYEDAVAATDGKE